MSEGSDEVQPDEVADAGPVDDDMKALLDSVLHQLLPAAIERMLPAGSAGQQLSADVCQASVILPAMLLAHGLMLRPAASFSPLQPWQTVTNSPSADL